MSRLPRMNKYTTPAIREIIGGWYRREDGIYCVAPGHKLVPKPLEIKTSILERIKYHYEPTNMG